MFYSWLTVDIRHKHTGGNSGNSSLTLKSFLHFLDHHSSLIINKTYNLNVISGDMIKAV